MPRSVDEPVFTGRSDDERGVDGIESAIGVVVILIGTGVSILTLVRGSTKHPTLVHPLA